MPAKVDSQVRLRRESDHELVFAHPTFGAFLLLPIGLAMAVLGPTHVEATLGRFMLVAGGVLFVAIGIFGVLWRHEVRFDLMQRTYDGRRGFWPAPRALAGSLKELECVALERRWTGSSRPDGQGAEQVEWVVQLELAGWDAPLRVFASRSERKAHQRLEQLARKLSVDAVDRSGPVETRRAAQRLDVALRDAPAADSVNARMPELPEGSRIVSTEDGRGARIALPPLGFGLATLFVMAFGSAFWGSGLLAILSANGWIDVAFHGSKIAAWVVGGVFVLFGGLLTIGSLIGSFARETVQEARDGLQFSLKACGFGYRNRFIAKRGVEEVALKPTTTTVRNAQGRVKHEVVVRGDMDIVRIGDELTDVEREWLRDTLRVLICR